MAATPATRPVAELTPEIAQAVHKLNAGDPTIVPTVMLWLGSEQDGLRVGQATPRLRVCFSAVRRFGLKQAMPWLVALYENPTAAPVARDFAAHAAIDVDPYYSRDFLRDVFQDDSLAPPGRNARGAAAVALASAGDEAARAFLLEAFERYLGALRPGRPTSGPNVFNWSTALELSRVSDPTLRDRVAALRERYPRSPARDRLQEMLQQLQTNLLGPDALLKIARSEAPADLGRRAPAVIALGHNAGPQVIPAIRAIERSLLEPLTRPTTAPATTQPSTEPATTRPATTQRTVFVPSWERDLLVSCRNAVGEIESRYPVPVNDPPVDPAATQPVSFPGPDVPPEGAELVRIDGAFVRAVNGVPTPFMTVSDPAGLLPLEQLLVKDDAVYSALSRISYGVLARAKLSDDRTELRWLRPVRQSPGEATPDGYVFVERRTLHEGKWEHLAVVLRKFGAEVVARIPNRRSDGGELRPDDKMAAVAQALNPGRAVEAGMDGGAPTMLTFLAPYRPPIPARLVKLTTLRVNGADRPALELVIARHQHTYLLPSEDGLYPTLDNTMLQSLPAGAELKVIVDDRSDPPALLAVRLEGGIAARADGSAVAVRGGRAAFFAMRSNDYRGSVSVITYPDPQASRLRIGLGRFLADAKKTGALSPEKLEPLRQAERSAALTFNPVDADLFRSLVTRWLSADPSDRPDLQRHLELRLTQISADFATRQQALVTQVRSLLTAEQYNQVIALARPAQAALRGATQPATRPAATEPAAPEPAATQPAD